MTSPRPGSSGPLPRPRPGGAAGLVSGWIGLPQTVGVVLAVALVTQAVTGNPGYVLIAALVVACALPFALTTPDARLPPPAGHRSRHGPSPGRSG